MKSTALITSIAALLATAHGLATPVRRTEAPRSPIPEGYGIVDSEQLEWEVETTPGGPKVALNGTVQQVRAQLLEINPKYDEEFAPIISERNAKALEETTPASPLHKRDWTVCWGRMAGARQERIIQGIHYLRGLSGEARNGPGPRNCGRVSCDLDNSIWYCNDNNFSKSMPWFHIANAAQVLVNECTWWKDNYTPQVSGERWHDDRWFVIVTNAPCN
ncbi:hypothetical protein QBC44DRAFT_399507 [Cladorrhinum sp. PSN332]|nr:hypothetical protein QBC44DRAFT_399507 [Cladorrhinum sp. PSN332]